MFDKYVLDNKKKLKCAIGLRYFNVYGQNEYHKKNMSSPVFTFYNQIKRDNFCKIFGKYDGFKRGEHTRDFIYIDDVVDINLWAAKKKFVDIQLKLGNLETKFKNNILDSIKEYKLIIKKD